MIMNKKITIITPFRNEEQNIQTFFKEVLSVINNEKGYEFEVICIDDGSSDKTLELLLKLAGRDIRFTVIQLSRGFGKEAALTAGIDYASGNAVVIVDADGQDPFHLISSLIREWEHGADVVLARRKNRDADHYLKRKTAQLYYKVHNLLSEVPIPENVGDFRLMDEAVVRAIRNFPEKERFMKGLFAWAGFESKTIDYSRQARSKGQSNFPARKLINFGIGGLTNFSSAPLRLSLYFGILTFGISIVYGFILIIKTILFGIDVPGYASIFTAILFIGGAQMLSNGIMGEYIGRIFNESKNRPVYIIKKIVKNEN
jgi:glycosyltransferase involved in cell wall biosynthesis